MRTPSRFALVSAALLGGGLLLAAPAGAQEADEYPADQPIGGGIEQPAQGGGDEAPAQGGPIGGGGGDEAPAQGGSQEDDGSTNAGGSVSNGSSGGAASLPFTGGEVTLIALAGTAALGGGIALTAAGRKRSTV